MKWSLQDTDSPRTLQELEEMLLIHRGVEDSETFFNPTHPQDISFDEVGISVSELDKAVKRVKVAIDNQEVIVVFGDYDADGVCSTTVLWEMLHGLGAQTTPFVPHREKHGYGMTDRSLDALFEQIQPNLVITVDNGIVAHQAASRLHQAGVDLIITDHHQPEKEETENGELSSYYPVAHAVIHSTKLCGTTVAWMFARELAEVARQEAWHLNKPALVDANRALDLCAIATVADQMRLLDANRSFIVHGLEALRTTARPGLVALYQAIGIVPEDLSASSINYALAPRINAMGRLDHSLEAVRLMCTTNAQRAAELAAVLGSTNSRRQELTGEMMSHAQTEAINWESEHLIIVASEEYHEGVIGLIAGKLVEQFSKPAIAISIGSQFAKASARSLPGINVVELIRQVRDDLLEVGGHPMAAGFGLLPEKIETIKQRLKEIAKKEITSELLEPHLDIECELPSELVTKSTVEILERFAPFGQGNPQPIFVFPEAEVVRVQVVGKQANHLRVGLVFDGFNETLWAMGWGMAGEFGQLAAGGIVRVRPAGCLEFNHWNGKTSLQLILKDLHLVS